AEVADEITRAVAEGREGEYGPVVVKVQRKFLGRREMWRWVLWGKEWGLWTEAAWPGAGWQSI
ncbi:hypothetical protein CGL51_12940, partial [Pyrobaculum aerophilum]